MKRVAITLLATLTYFAGGSFDRVVAQPATPNGSAPSPAATATTRVPEDPAVTARAKDWFARLQRSDLDRSQLLPIVNDSLTETKAKELAGQIGPLGTPTSFAYVNTEKRDPLTVFIYTLTFKDGSKFEYTFSLDAQGKIGDLNFKPL